MQTFKQFWQQLQPDERRDILKRSGIPRNTIDQILIGNRNAGLKTIMRLKSADNRITDKMMRPDIY